MSDDRSPYVVSLVDLVLRFGIAAVRQHALDRQGILDGFLRYRESLHAVGLVSGFQWLDGSFLEDVESTQSRSPNDIDVVTFFRLPAGRSQADVLSANASLFSGAATKHQFRVDGYFQSLETSADLLVHSSAYWYSVWSHQRGGAWKGFLEIDLAQSDDVAARQALLSIRPI